MKVRPLSSCENEPLITNPDQTHDAMKASRVAMDPRLRFYKTSDQEADE